MKNRFSKSFVTRLSLIAVMLTGAVPTFAAESKFVEKSVNQASKSKIPAANTSKHKTSVYIVQFIDQPIASYDGDKAGMAATKAQGNSKINANSPKVKTYQSFLTGQQDTALANCGVSKYNKIYEYTFSFNGMAATMTKAQAELMRAEPNVVRVTKDRLLKTTSDSTRNFLGLTNSRNGAWGKGYTGEDVIIGVLDSGIYPEHPSFADTPTPELGDRGGLIPFDAPPAGWSGDECDFGNTAFNPDDAPFECNNKLLGARTYSAGFLAGGDPAVVFASGTSLSARDDDGHGSAAASNAAGNYGVQAVINGEEVGDDVISGMAPRARIAAYKVCWEGPLPGGDDDGCARSDSMAAIDQAVADGVDVINFSIGGASASFGEADSVAFLFAENAGVHVATSAGNSGPDLATVGAPGIVPWITSVGAINDNQNFALGVEVVEPASVAGLKTAIEGDGAVQLKDISSITDEVVLAEPANGCAPLTNSATIGGKIALIIRGGCTFDDKYANAEAAGALALVVYNDGTASDRFNPLVMGNIDPSRGIAGVMIGFNDGDALASETGVSITLDSENQIPLENTVVDFSSRGPNRGAFDIIKPDVVAPGVNILSAETPFETVDSGAGGQTFQFISGTSFSSPHVAGVLALIKQAHPDWTPAIARSALMTTARQNLTTQFSDEPATPFDIGAGHVVPNDSFNPGLAYNAGIADYAAFSCGNNVRIFSQALCDSLESAGFSFDGSDLNLPSIGVGSLIGTQTVTRTVTNVDVAPEGRRRPRPAVYRAVVEAPDGISVRVKPRILILRPGESADYTVTFTTKRNATFNAFTFGSLTWSQLGGDRRGKGRREVRSPIAVRPVAFSTVSEVLLSGVTNNAVIPVNFGYSGDYSAVFSGFGQATPIADTVLDADGFNMYCFDLPAQDHLRISTFDEDTGTPGADDIDLRLFTVDDCDSFANLTQIGASEFDGSEEFIDIANPAASGYVAIVDYFAAGEGDSIDFVLWLNAVLGDQGNATVTAPTSARVGNSDTVNVSYEGLNPDTRYLGVISHQDDDGELVRTVIDINTQ